MTEWLRNNWLALYGAFLGTLGTSLSVYNWRLRIYAQRESKRIKRVITRLGEFLSRYNHLHYSIKKEDPKREEVRQLHLEVVTYLEEELGRSYVARFEADNAQVRTDAKESGRGEWDRTELRNNYVASVYVVRSDTDRITTFIRELQ